MSSLNQLIIAVERAESAAQTLLDVMGSQAEQVPGELNDVFTLSKRITDHLNNDVPNYKGEDGANVTSVEFRNKDLVVVYDNGMEDIFTDVLKDDGLSIQNFTVSSGGNLIQEWSNLDSDDLGMVVGGDGIELTGVSIINDGTFTITYGDGSTQTGIGNFGNFATNTSITAATIINNELFVELSDSSTLALGHVKGEPGESAPDFVGVTNFRADATTVYLDFEMANGNTFRAGPAQTDIRVADPSDVLDLELDSDGILQLFVPNVGTVNLGDVDGTDGIDANDGADGVTITSAEAVNNATELAITLSDSTVINAGSIQQILVPAGTTTITSTTITPSGDLIFAIDVDGNTINVNVGKVRGDNGINGKTISNVVVNVDDDIVMTVNDNGTFTNTVLGSVKYDRPATAEIDPIRQLVITMESGAQVIAEGSPDGEDGLAGAWVETIMMDPNNELMLSFGLTDGTTIENVGKVRPFQTHDVALVNDELVFNFADASSVNLGTLLGGPGRNVTNVVLAGDTVSIDYDTPETEVVSGSIRTTTAFEYDDVNSELVSTLSDTNTRIITYDRPDYAAHGIWLTDASKNSLGELVLTYSDTTIENLGVIDGDWIIELNKTGDDYSVKWLDDQSFTPLATLVDDDGENGRWLTNIAFDVNDDIEYTLSDSSTVVIPNVHGQILEDITKDGDDFFIRYFDPTVTDEYPTGYTNIGTIPNVDGIDGTVPQELVINDDGELVITWYDTTVENIGRLRSFWPIDIYHEIDDFFVQYSHLTDPVFLGTVPGFEGADGRWITSMAISNGDLEVVWNDETDPTVIGRADGIDGTWIEELYRDGTDVMVRFNDEVAVSSIGDISFIDGVEGRWAESMTIVPDPQDARIENLFIKFNDEVDDTFISQVSGVDGIWITNFTKVNGELEVTFNDGSVTNVGQIDGLPFNTEITNIELVDGKLAVTSTGGSVVETDVVARRLLDSSVVDDVLFFQTNHLPSDIEVGNTAGADYADGVYINNVFADYTNQQLVVEMSDTSTINAGLFDRVDIDTIVFDDVTGNLVITLTDTTQFTLGPISGISDVVNVVDGFINLSGNLVLTFDEGAPSQETTSPVVGADGIGITSASVDSGFLNITLDDATVINAGFVQQDLGFAAYDVTRTYDRGESATFDGRIYVAVEDGVTSEPSPDNSQWAIVRLLGDLSPDASRPDVISPSSDEVVQNLRPFILGGPLRNYYSIDTRLNRIFQIDEEGGNFITPIYTATENADGHQVEMDLDPTKNYRWRIRDVIKETGYISDWSLEGSFTVTQGDVVTPFVTAGQGYDINNMIAMAGFEVSAYFGNGFHSSTSWQIKRASDDAIIYEDLESSDKTGTVIPFAYLKENTDYYVRAKHIGTLAESAWSDWLAFKTTNVFDMTFTPVIEFVGSDINATIAKPYFHSDTLMPRFFDEYLEGKDLQSVWEVYNASQVLVWTSTNAIDIHDVQVLESLESGVSHTIRVKYTSDRFATDSEWSNVITFTPSWSIDKPVVSYSGELLSVSVDSTFDSSIGVFVNDEHMYSDWEVRRQSDDLLLYSRYGTFTEIAAWDVFFEATDSQGEYYVRTRHNGRYASSLWSDPLNFTVEEIVTTFVYSGSNDTTVRKLDSNGNEIWSFTGHTNTVYGVAVDSEGNVYSGSSDTSVRKIDSTGNQIWSFTGHTSNVNGVAVDSDGNVYSGSADLTVRKIDSNGNEVWSFNDHTNTVFDVAVDSEGNVYSGSNDRTVRKIDPNGNQIWSFTGHTNTVHGVAVDSDGNVYSGSFDQTVRKIDSSGNEVWSFTGHTGAVYGVAVDVNGNVYSGSADNTVRKIDPNGNQIWSFTGHTSPVFSVAVDSEGNVYSGSQDTTARKIDSSGNEIWSFTGHTHYVRTVAVTVDVSILKPTELEGRFYELVAPENLTATNI